MTSIRQLENEQFKHEVWHKPVHYIVIDERRYELFELLRLLEDLEDTDGLFVAIMVKDPFLKESLLKRAVIRETIHGVHWRGPLYWIFKKKMEVIADEVLSD